MRPNGIFGGTLRSIVGRYIPTTIIIRNGSGNQILGWKLKAMMLYITDIWELVLHHLVSLSPFLSVVEPILMREDRGLNK